MEQPFLTIGWTTHIFLMNVNLNWFAILAEALKCYYMKFFFPEWWFFMPDWLNFIIDNKIENIEESSMLFMHCQWGKNTKVKKNTSLRIPLCKRSKSNFLTPCVLERLVSYVCQYLGYNLLYACTRFWHGELAKILVRSSQFQSQQVSFSPCKLASLSRVSKFCPELVKPSKIQNIASTWFL